MTCTKKGERASLALKEVSDFHKACRPKHARCMEYGDLEWYEACNDAFVQKMREVYPEWEIITYGSISK